MPIGQRLYLLLYLLLGGWWQRQSKAHLVGPSHQPRFATWIAEDTGFIGIVLDDEHKLSVFSESSGFRDGGRWLYPGAGLHLRSIVHGLSGQDGLGAYIKAMVTWRAEATGKHFQTNVRAYVDYPAVVLEQVFPNGTENSALESEDEVVTSFPTFRTSSDIFFGDKGFLTFAHNMACSSAAQENQNLFCTFTGTFGGDSANKTLSDVRGQEGGVPMVIFDEHSTATIVISPMDNFMATNMWYDNQTEVMHFGIQGRVHDLPAGHTVNTLVWVSNTGVNDALEGWGAALQQYYGVRHAHEKDVSVTHLSYYSDNGGYYYYLPLPNRTYEDTIVEVWEHAKEQGIPYRSLQLDSWWYVHGRDDGAKRWDARPDVFPNGLTGLQRRLGGNVPIVAHNRWWSVETDYAKQFGGKYEFVIEPRKPLPSPPLGEAVATSRRVHRRLFGNDYVPLPYGAAMPLEKRFWDDLFAWAKEWGLYTYEQDWLHNEFMTLNHTLATVDGARTWLLQMGDAAREAGINIQYCMGFPRFYMQTLEVPAVTHIRVSDDYGPSSRPDQWALGDTALLAHALGLAPFKDAFWSSMDEPGNPYNGTEDKPALEAAISTLTAGPVGPADRIGAEDKELILRSCNADGLLLKPSRPITAIDSSFIRRAFGLTKRGPAGAVYSTHSRIGDWRFDIALGAALNESYQLSMKDLRIAEDMLLVAYSPAPYQGRVANATSLTLQRFSGGEPLTFPACGRQDFVLWYTSPPLASGAVLLGELAKWVPVSPQRIAAIMSREDVGETQVHVVGAAQEVVELYFTTVHDLQVRPVAVKCVLSEQGTAVATVVVGDAVHSRGIVHAACA